MGKVAELVYDWAKPIAEKKGLELVDTEFVKEGNQWYLRVFIDKKGGVTLNDCQAVSEELEPILDERDPTEHSYILEVSSPGIDRPLKSERDFLRHIGDKIEVKTFAPVNGEKIWVGELMDYKDGELVLLTETGEMKIPQKAIALARLHLEFEF